MSMNPKSLKNLKPYKKGVVHKKEDLQKGGEESAKVRRRNASFKKSLETLLSKQPLKNTQIALKNMGYDDVEDIDNADALLATVFSMAMKGDKKAAEMIMNFQMQLSEDERKNKESDARIQAMTKGDVSVSSGDENGSVVIYMPEIDKENE